MGIRPEFRWWLLTLAIVAVLLGISALALQHPDVVWTGGAPHCPQCRAEVPFYATRCPTCREQFDWAVAPEETSPLSPFSLSPLEATAVRVRIKALGEPEAARRVAKALDITSPAAERYLQALGTGRCGWCGGTGTDPATATGESARPCPVCLGRGYCIACNGDRRVRMGDPGAGAAFRAYATALQDVAPWLPLEDQRAEARRLGELFVRRWSGTVEATYVVFWPTWEVGKTPWLDHPDSLSEKLAPVEPTTAVGMARRRLDEVVAALEAE